MSCLMLSKKDSIKAILMTDFKKMPYPLFFIIGIFYSLVGVLLWPLTFLNIVFINNVLEFHVFFMLSGFIFSFALGFILTALPNFTNSPKVFPCEFYSLIISQIGIFLGLLLNNLIFSGISLLFSLMGILFFIYLRLKLKKLTAPASFYFIPLALLYAIFSVLMLIVNKDLGSVAKKNLEFGFVLNLILGIGMKVIPVMLGNVESNFSFTIDKNNKTGFVEFFKSHKIYIHIIALNIFIVVCSFSENIKVHIPLALILFYTANNHINLLRVPNNSTYLTKGILTALWFMPIGVCLRGFEKFNTFGLHLYFISGISLLTFMIAGRVTLAHGGFGLIEEKTNKKIIYFIFLVLLAALFRFIPSIKNNFDFMSFIEIAALLWVIFILFWLNIFGTKLITTFKRST